VTLTGRTLHLKDLLRVACDRAPVRLQRKALARMRRRHRALLRAALWGQPVYGVNRGVGAFRDRPVPARRREYFERRLVDVHLGGVGPPLGETAVRAAMTLRLNSLLVGTAGARPELATAFAELLDAGIHPVVPRRGSVGEADITLLAHIGQALLGEGRVTYQGKPTSARRALAAAGLRPLVPGPRDGLAMVSSSAVSSGLAALTLAAATRVLDAADLVHALSLEGLRGHVAPLDPDIHQGRPSPGIRASAARIRGQLAGGELLEVEPRRTLQDPISFRVTAHVHGAAWDALSRLEETLESHWNCGEDNPWVTEEGRVLATGAFDPLRWVLDVEGLTLALAHVGRVACRRVIRLGEASRTGLRPYLSGGGRLSYGLSELQKTAASLVAELKAFASPASLDDESLAEGQEDHAVLAPLAVRRAAAAVDLVAELVAMEALHAMRAVAQRGPIRLGRGTRRTQVLLTHALSTRWRDRDMTGDIERAYRLVAGGLLSA
jgi:histidine ammonia-lyase